jgi:hypothetical protein
MAKLTLVNVDRKREHKTTMKTKYYPQKIIKVKIRNNYFNFLSNLP